MKQKYRITAIALALMAAGAAHASGWIDGATLPEQIVQELTMIESLASEVQTEAHALANLQSAFSGAGGLLPWNDPAIKQALGSLVKTIAQAQGVSYTFQNVAQNVADTFGDPGKQITNLSQQVANWTADTNSQIAAVLQQYQLDAKDFETQQDALATIQQKSQSASGAMDLMQAGNQISGMMVTQIQKLQSDIQAGNQLIANRIGQQANQEAHNDDAMKRWLSGQDVDHPNASVIAPSGTPNPSVAP
jgi:P-type conjugative transfer protein TrbJ